MASALPDVLDDACLVFFDGDCSESVQLLLDSLPVEDLAALARVRYSKENGELMSSALGLAFCCCRLFISCCLLVFATGWTHASPYLCALLDFVFVVKKITESPTEVSIALLRSAAPIA